MRTGKLKSSVKTGLVFFIYTLLVSAAFLGSVFLFQRQLQQADPFAEAGDRSYYALEQVTQDQIQQDGFGLISPNQITEPERLSKAYYAQLLWSLVPLTIFFCLFLLVTSVLFWSILKRVQEKSTQEIAGHLHTIIDGDVPWNTEVDLAPAYASLSRQMETHFEDYRRLSAYLSHEQKNAIARMRTRMELEENSTYLTELDDLTAGLDDILTLSDSSGVPTGPVDVTAVCASVCDDYQKVTGMISFDFDDRDETTIEGKERWVARAVSNLVDNAVKYGGGKPVKVGVKSLHGSVVVTVEDQGPGISEEDQKNVFDYCYRVNPLNRDGYGIGLSLVAHVCDLCGASVTVDSVLGSGSTFYLSFPQKKAPPIGRMEALEKHTACYTAPCKSDNRPHRKGTEGQNHMYIFTNALKNIWRNKGRNVLLFCVILLMILSTVVSVVINTATGNTINAYKAKFGSEVTLIRSNHKIEEQNIPLSSLQVPSLEDYQKYGASALLKSKTYAATAFVLMEGLDTLDQGKSEGAGIVGESGSTPGQTGGNFFTRPVATLIGSSDPQGSAEFENGLRKIREGKFSDSKNTCVVSQKFAELNGLTVGSSVTFSNYSYTGEEVVSQTLTISGIYEDNVPAGSSGVVTSSTNRGNEILTSLSTFTSLPLYENAKSNGMLDIQVSFILKNPDLADAFQNELYEKGLPTYYTVSADAAKYNKAVGPVEGLSRIATTFMAVVLVLGSLILILLSTLAIRERKYEVGVLRAMGMKKAKIALGMVTEMVIITAACLVIGLGAGAAASQPITDSLLQNQVQVSQSDPTSHSDEVSSGIQSGQSTVTELDTRLSGAAIGQIAMISLLLALVSSAAGVIFITRYEPVKILSERN
ncbi:ATP-binding protein [Neobittarella massiliensis]|uniref:ATP-binding protein n=1 Tax=Neobittarella massiliensis (ex Bilen et al. 2018) TaxID=2041842 RepID=UPI0013ED393B|nr:ATP-binding protein [Neobittarella massiliensis]